MPFLIFILIFINLSTWSIISDFHRQESFVSFLNIGQGNSVLISNPKTISLYDTGPNGFITIQEINKFLPFYKKRIDLLFLSHSDTDHYGGSFEIIKKFQISAIIIPPLFSEDSGWQELMNLAKIKNIPLIKLTALNAIKTPNENFLILNPSQNPNKKLFKTDNENSLVVKFSQSFQDNQRKTFLLTGDISKKIEEYLIGRYNLKSDYLLIPHHGSKYSSSEKFLKEVMPNSAIIQVGRNKYGHPNKETLKRLENLNIEYWRTDLNGSLLIK